MQSSIPKTNEAVDHGTRVPRKIKLQKLLNLPVRSKVQSTDELSGDTVLSLYSGGIQRTRLNLTELQASGMSVQCLAEQNQAQNPG